MKSAIRFIQFVLCTVDIQLTVLLYLRQAAERRPGSGSRRRARSAGVRDRQARLRLPGQRVRPLHAVRLQLCPQPVSGQRAADAETPVGRRIVNVYI